MLESNLIARQHIQRSKCQIFHMHPRIHAAYLTAARIGRSPIVTFTSVFLGLMYYSISSVNGVSRYSMCGAGSSNHWLVKIEAYTSTTWTRMTSLSLLVVRGSPSSIASSPSLPRRLHLPWPQPSCLLSKLLLSSSHLRQPPLFSSLCSSRQACITRCAQIVYANRRSDPERAVAGVVSIFHLSL